MAGNKIDFGHAFERWNAIARHEQARLDGALRDSKVVTSWEALDHLCGLAAESGIKALLFHLKVVKPDALGDFPASVGERRPHIDELWDHFTTAVQGRRDASLWSRLGAPAAVFSTWRSAHRYAPDGTVTRSVTEQRATFLKKLQRVLEEEGVY